MGFAPAQGSGSSTFRRRVCVFVDGQNFLHVLKRVVSGFKPKCTPLPPTLEWERLFAHLASLCIDTSVRPTFERCYWYVPGRAGRRENAKRKDDEAEAFRRRQEQWHRLDEGYRAAERRSARLCFRRFGLMKPEEKGVDVGLAVDMLRLVDTYDAAVVVTRDADLIPAIEAVKDWGRFVAVPRFVEDGSGEDMAPYVESLLGSADKVLLVGESVLRDKLGHGASHAGQSDSR